jgi:hypothetical protein
MQQVAVSNVNEKVVLASVEVVTHHGDVYKMPAMDVVELGRVVPRGSSSIPEGTTSLSLVNASIAVLIVPFRIMKTILVDGEVWWSC